MAKKSSKKFTKPAIFRNRQTQRLIAILVVFIVAGIGIRLLTGTHAASPYAVANADKGTLSTTATSVVDSTASDGHRVQFGTSGSSGGMVPTPPGLDSTYKTLAFDDEFTGTTLNTSKWETCVWYAACHTANSIGDANGGTADPANVSVNNGLTLAATSSTPTVASSWGDGWIDSAPYYETPNGNYYVEIKAKLPAGAPGLWPALVLYEDGDLPPSGKTYAEMDILEAITEADDACATNTTTGWQSWVPPSFSGISKEIGGAGASGCNINYTGWNTYGIAVSSTGSIQYYFNANVNSSPIVVGSNATEGMYISLGLTTGGTANNGWAGAPTTATPSPSIMNVAYVRVFTP